MVAIMTIISKNQMVDLWEPLADSLVVIIFFARSKLCRSYGHPVP
jgi:hypothetical protein